MRGVQDKIWIEKAGVLVLIIEWLQFFGTDTNNEKGKHTFHALNPLNCKVLVSMYVGGRGPPTY